MSVLLRVDCPTKDWNEKSMILCHLLTKYESGDFNNGLENDWMYGFFHDESNILVSGEDLVWTANNFEFTFSELNFDNFIGEMQDSDIKVSFEVCME